MNQENGRIYTQQALNILRDFMKDVPTHLRPTVTCMLASHLMKSAEKYRGQGMGCINE